MTIKRKDGKISVSIRGRNDSEDVREALREIMGNLSPEAQLQRMRNRLELARTAGLPDSLYQVLKGELDDGYPEVVKDSLLAWKDRETRSHGGRQQLVAIVEAVEQLLDEQSKITNKEAWKWFPDNRDSAYEIERGESDYTVYRDGEKLVQLNSLNTRESAISRRSFEDYYLTPARKSRKTRTM